MGAFCLAALGEWDRALAVLEPLLRAGTAPRWAVDRARYLEACCKAWIYSDAGGLRSLADDPHYGDMRRLVFYTLWKISARIPEIAGAGTAAEWKLRLIAEFPQSPEARIAASEDTSVSSAAISSLPRAMWLLMPEGWQTAGVTPAVAVGAPAVNSGVPGGTPAGAPTATGIPAVPAGTYLQTGLFGSEANAQNQTNRLRAAGFTPLINRRTVNGNVFWSVVVPAGANMNQTIQELKRAGFDSFPLP
jgi:hypothetical protein